VSLGLQGPTKKMELGRGRRIRPHHPFVHHAGKEEKGGRGTTGPYERVRCGRLREIKAKALGGGFLIYKGERAEEEGAQGLNLG